MPDSRTPEERKTIKRHQTIGVLGGGASGLAALNKLNPKSGLGAAAAVGLPTVAGYLAGTSTGRRSVEKSKEKNGEADVALIRKVAAADLGRRALDELTSSVPLDNSLDEVLQSKVASAEDPELFKVAASMPGDVNENYEAFGGKYKTGAWVSARELKAVKDRVSSSAPVKGLKRTKELLTGSKLPRFNDASRRVNVSSSRSLDKSEKRLSGIDNSLSLAQAAGRHGRPGQALQHADQAIGQSLDATNKMVGSLARHSKARNKIEGLRSAEESAVNTARGIAGGAAGAGVAVGSQKALERHKKRKRQEMRKAAFGTPMFQATAAPDPSQGMGVPGAAPGAPKPAAAVAPTPAAPAVGATSGGPTGAAGPRMGGVKAPGMGGGSTNPMSGPSVATIPGAGGEKTAAAQVVEPPPEKPWYMKPVHPALMGASGAAGGYSVADLLGMGPGTRLSSALAGGALLGGGQYLALKHKRSGTD